MKRTHFKYALLLLISSSLSYSQIDFDEQGLLLGLVNNSGSIILGGGISFVDFDDDGWDDITVTSAEDIPLRFYKNFNGTYTEIFPLPEQITYTTKSTTWVDYDNDGDKDLFVTSDSDGNRLYNNDGNFSFTDVTASAGFPTANMFTYGASWGEIDNDGYLDVFISNRIVTGNTISNFLYKNNGDGTFTNYTETAGIATNSELTFCSGFIDYDNDGYQDIYIANDKNFVNIMYRNNGNGTYTNTSLQSNTGIVIDAMSVTVDDFNSDGNFDMYVTNTYFPISDPGGNVFFKNNGDGTFTDIAGSTGTKLESFAWGAVFLDVENDGDLDLYVSGSEDGSTPGVQSYAFYENLGSEMFQSPNNTGLEGNTNSSFSNSIGDVDNDGQLDIAIFNNADRPTVYKNNTATSNNYLGITLTGTTSNKDGIGSVIEISVDGNKQFRYTMCGEGYMSQSTEKEIFGVGSSNLVDYVKVTWLSGMVDTLFNVNVNQILNIEEGSTLSLVENEKNEVKVYPTIADDRITIESPFTSLNSIGLYDVNGKLVLEEEFVSSASKYSLSMSILSPGFYTIIITTDSKRKAIKKIFKK